MQQKSRLTCLDPRLAMQVHNRSGFSIGSQDAVDLEAKHAAVAATLIVLTLASSISCSSAGCMCRHAWWVTLHLEIDNDASCRCVACRVQHHAGRLAHPAAQQLAGSVSLA